MDGIGIFIKKSKNFNFVNWGFNVRPTELQAGFGLEQIKK